MIAAPSKCNIIGCVDCAASPMSGNAPDGEIDRLPRAYILFPTDQEGRRRAFCIFGNLAAFERRRSLAADRLRERKIAVNLPFF